MVECNPMTFFYDHDAFQLHLLSLTQRSPLPPQFNPAMPPRSPRRAALLPVCDLAPP